MTMRKFLGICWALLAVSACTIREGDFNWDSGSLFDDASTRRDGATVVPSDADGGVIPKDASAADAGKDAGATDAGKDASAADAGKDASVGDASADAAAEDAGRPLTLGDVASVFATGRCGALEACMGKELLLASYGGNDCVDFTTRQQQDRHLHWLAGSVSANRVTFRPEELLQCQKDLVKLGCDVASHRLPASCELAVEGKASVDDNCTIDQDCKGDAYCDKGMLETCPGTCAAPQPSGLPCTVSAQCADGLVCRSGNCKAQLAEGEACTARKGTECPPGLLCQGKDGMLTCQSIASVYAGKEGEACDLYGKLCQTGLVCQSQSASSTMGTCAKPVAVNGTCRVSEPGQCPITQYCKDARSNVTTRAPAGKDGVCVDLPADGAACIGTSSQSGQPLCPVGSLCCAPGTVCVGTPSAAMCHSVKMAGGACTSNAECYSARCAADSCEVSTIECK
jgi:hypothetical protein